MAAAAAHHHHHLAVGAHRGSPTAEAAAAAALQHQRALSYSQLAAAAAVANGAVVGAAAGNGPTPAEGGALMPNEALLAANDATAAAALAGGLALGPLGIDAHAAVPSSSTETLLRNIQSLLKVAADNARQQERQISYEKGESKGEGTSRVVIYTDLQGLYPTTVAGKHISSFFFLFAFLPPPPQLSSRWMCYVNVRQRIHWRDNWLMSANYVVCKCLQGILKLTLTSYKPMG